MPMPRKYTDEQLRSAVANAATWADVMEMIGKNRSRSHQQVKEVAERLGLDTSHFGYGRSATLRGAVDLPFTNLACPGGKSGLSVAARWFLDRGYAVSVPLEPTCYDLITDSDDGLQKIQVKTTRKLETSKRYSVALMRTIYDSTASANARGKYRQVAYAAGMVDYFFIVTAADSLYLIPFSAVEGKRRIVLDRKYSSFAVT